MSARTRHLIVLVVLSLVLSACASQSTIDVDTAISEGTQLLEEGDASAALKALAGVSDADATAEIWYLRGNAYASLGETENARDAYKTALELDASLTDAQANLGVVLYELSDFEGAETQFRAVVEAQPNDADLHYNLGGVLLALGQLEEAEAELKLAISLDETLAEPYLGLGTLYELTGDNEAAIDAYTKFIELSDDSYWIEQANAAITRLEIAQ